jgi:flagellar motor switch protein FliN/FliY
MAQPKSQAGTDTGEAAPRRPLPGPSGAGEQQDYNDAPTEAPERVQFRGFLDLPILVGVQMGRKLVKFRELLALEVDSVIRMDKSAGENVDLLLENLPVGRGEIIVIEDLMGLRITDLTQPETGGEKEVAGDD